MNETNRRRPLAPFRLPAEFVQCLPDGRCVNRRGDPLGRAPHPSSATRSAATVGRPDPLPPRPPRGRSGGLPTVPRPLACHAADASAAEGRAPMLPDNWPVRIGTKHGPVRPVRSGRVLREGDELAGFRVVHAPGHTPGHIVFFRDADRVAVAGDLLANATFLTDRPRLREPPAFLGRPGTEPPLGSPAGQPQPLRRLLRTRRRSPSAAVGAVCRWSGVKACREPGCGGTSWLRTDHLEAYS